MPFGDRVFGEVPFGDVSSSQSFADPTQTPKNYRKRFLYKIYDSAGNFITTWGDVINDAAFSSVINGGLSELEVQLARTESEYDEGRSVAYNNRIKLYVFDRDVTDPAYQGTLVYSGVLTRYIPFVSEKSEGLRVTFLSHWTQLAQIILENAGATLVSYVAVDPTFILKDLLDKFTAAGGVLDYAGGTTELAGTSVSYAFNTATFQEALLKVLDLSPAEWYLRVGADDLVYFLQRTASLNIISNADFETNTAGWAAYIVGATITRVTAEHFMGAASLRVVAAGTPVFGFYGGASYVGAAGELVIGKTYTISARVKGAVGGESLNVYSGFGANEQAGFTLTTAWQKVTLSVVATSTTPNFILRTQTASATFFIDEVELFVADADHIITLGKDVIEYTPEKRIENIVNTIYFVGGGTPTKFYKKYVSSGSVAAYGIRAMKYVDERITESGAADKIAARLFAFLDAPEIRVTIKIMDNNGDAYLSGRGYDIETFHVGQTVRLLNATSKDNNFWDVALWDIDAWDFDITNAASLQLQIMSVQYAPDYAIVELSNRQPNIVARIEELNKQLVDSVTADNPTTPT